MQMDIYVQINAKTLVVQCSEDTLLRVFQHRVVEESHLPETCFTLRFAAQILDKPDMSIRAWNDAHSDTPITNEATIFAVFNLT